MGGAVEETLRTYAAIATEYARRTGEIDSALLDDVAVLASTLSSGSVVADVGCGPGRDVAVLRARGLRVIGVDMSAAQLRAGGVRGVVQADMRRLPLRPQSVDAIWCRAALLHIPRDEVPLVLAEFARAVRPHGELFLAVAEGDGEGWEVAARYGSDRGRWFTYHREEVLTALLHAAGFQVHRAVHTRNGRSWLSVNALRTVTDQA